MTSKRKPKPPTTQTNSEIQGDGYSRLQSRKLWILLVLSLLATVFLVQGVASFPDWADLMKWAFASYTVGNVGSKIAYAIETKPRPNTQLGSTTSTSKEIEDERSGI